MSTDLTSEEYWKKRCELAEAYIKERPKKPATTGGEHAALIAWLKFKRTTTQNQQP